jgi:hypothetical protein
MTTLADLKRNQKNNLEKLIAESEKYSKNGKKDYPKDPRFWTPTVDEAGNGSAVLRFLPAPEGEDVPWARYFDHFFKGPTGKVYREKSLMSLKLPDPVAEFNKGLWDAKTEASIAQARKQKRREHFISNVEIINDPAVPENNGQIFLYRFGKKIYENKIKALMYPDETDPDEIAINPYDLLEGCNFKLKIKKVADFRNYDESSFSKQSAHVKSEEDLQRVLKGVHSLKEWKEAANYKSYDELKRRFEEVMAEGDAPAKSIEQIEKDMEAVSRVVARKTTAATTSVTDSVDVENIDLESLLGDDI